MAKPLRQYVLVYLLLLDTCFFCPQTPKANAFLALFKLYLCSSSTQMEWL